MMPLGFVCAYRNLTNESVCTWLIVTKTEGLDSCNRPIKFTCPVWPWNRTDALQNNGAPSFLVCELKLGYRPLKLDPNCRLLSHMTVEYDENAEGTSSMLPGERFKNAYELLNLRALKIPMLYKNRIFQCMGKIFCVEFQRVPLKFHTKNLTHTLKDVNFIHRWNFKSS